MSIKIKRSEVMSIIVDTIISFDELSFLSEVPKNIKEKAYHEIVSGFISALNECNQSKTNGEFKTTILNAITELTGYDLDLNKKPERTDQWEKAAEIAYHSCYECRVSREALLEGASRILRGIALFSPMTRGKMRIHYAPENEIVDRFFSKISGMISEPRHDQENITSIDGLPFIKDLVPLSIAEYRSSANSKGIVE